LFELLQSLLVISVIPICETGIMTQLQSLNAKKKSKLASLILRGLCNLMNEKTITYYTHIYHFILVILQEFESMDQTTFVMALRLLSCFQKIGKYATEADDTHKGKLRTQLLLRFYSSNHSQSFYLIGQILPHICRNNAAMQDKFCAILFERLFDYSWEIRDSSLCIFHHLIQAPSNDIDATPIISKLLFQNQRESLQLIILKKLKDSSQFVRLTALSVLQTLFEKRLYNGDVRELFTSIAQVIEDSDFSVRKHALLVFKTWAMDGIFSPIDLIVYESFIAAFRSGMIKIENEFDFESMYYVLSLVKQLYKCPTVIADVWLKLILDTNIYDIIYECITNASVERSQILAIEIAQNILKYSYAGQFKEKLDKLQEEINTSNAEDEINYQKSKKDNVENDIVDFFTFNNESYDCY
jgi:hypothetical protein